MLVECNCIQTKSKKSVIALGICPACSNENICLIPISYIRLYNFNINSYPQGKKQEQCWGIEHTHLNKLQIITWSIRKSLLKNTYYKLITM